MTDLGQQPLHVAVVVPAYNEERHISRVIRSMPPVVRTVIVVDDASTDATRTRVQQLMSEYERVHLCRHERNEGVGAAICTGYREALNRSADVVVVMAGDAQMDPKDLPALLEPLRRDAADHVKGNRLAERRSARRMPRWRRWGSRVLSSAMTMATGVPIADSQCGYTATRAQLLHRIDLSSVWPRYGYPNDLTGRLVMAGARVKEVPVEAIYADEASGLTVFHVPRILGLIGRVAWWRWSRRMSVRLRASRSV